MSEQPVKKSNTLIIVIAILAVLCLGCGGLAAFCTYQTKEALGPAFDTGFRGTLLQNEIRSLVAEDPSAATNAESLRAALLLRDGFDEESLTDGWGKPFYFIQRDGSWLCYSGGMNGVDDGGSQDDMFFNNSGN